MKLLGKEWNELDDYCTKISNRVKTGFPTIDRLLKGLPGLVTVQGEPKSCKSTFVLDIALYNARRNVPVLWIDYENGLQLTRLRVLSLFSSLPISQIEQGNFNDQEQKKIEKAKAVIDSLSFFYTEEIPSDIEQVFLDLKQHDKQVLFVLDSLQSIAVDHTQKRAEADRVMYELNQLKNQYAGDLTVIVVSEKNRSSYGSASRSGGKESGGIEYKSELVLDMYRKMLPDGNFEDTINLNCDHNRHGYDGHIVKLLKPDPYYYLLKEQEYLPE